MTAKQTLMIPRRSAAVKADVLAPFFRRGKLIPLTSTDYANRAGITLGDAVMTIQRLSRAGLIRTTLHYDGGSYRTFEVDPGAAIQQLRRMGRSALQPRQARSMGVAE